MSALPPRHSTSALPPWHLTRSPGPLSRPSISIVQIPSLSSAIPLSSLPYISAVSALGLYVYLPLRLLAEFIKKRRRRSSPALNELAALRFRITRSFEELTNSLWLRTNALLRPRTRRRSKGQSKSSRDCLRPADHQFPAMTILHDILSQETRRPVSTRIRPSPSEGRG